MKGKNNRNIRLRLKKIIEMHPIGGRLNPHLMYLQLEQDDRRLSMNMNRISKLLREFENLKYENSMWIRVE